MMPPDEAQDQANADKSKANAKNNAQDLKGAANKGRGRKRGDGAAGGPSVRGGRGNRGNAKPRNVGERGLKVEGSELAVSQAVSNGEAPAGDTASIANPISHQQSTTSGQKKVRKQNRGN